MKFGESIRNIRISRGYTQKTMSELLGVSTEAVQAWERGARQPNIDSLIVISERLGVSVDAMLGLKPGETVDGDELRVVHLYRRLDDPGREVVDAVLKIEVNRVATFGQEYYKTNRKGSHVVHIHQIPLYFTPSAAGIATPILGDDYEMISSVDAPRGADFAVRIQGDSMDPYIGNNTIVYVQKTDSIENEEIGIFVVDGSTYCKQYYKNSNGTLYLLSANPEQKNANIILHEDSGSSIALLGRVLMPHTVDLPDYFEDR